MNINWKTTTYMALDTVLVIYLILAVTSFTTPNQENKVCNEVKISITDEENYGFLSANEIKSLLVSQDIYPQAQRLDEIDPRAIEEKLQSNTFVEKAECYKTIDGTVNIKVSQRMPYIRVIADNGDNYYLDKDGNMMQGEGYTSDLIIATGHISRQYARDYLTEVSKFISANDFWRNQIEQINILSDGDMEIVPRVGNHVVKLGNMPQYNDKKRREEEIDAFLSKKLQRLEKFYFFGLNKIGWNKYKYINLEFDNQIICKKNDGKFEEEEIELNVQATNMENQSSKEDLKEKEKPNNTKEKTAEKPKEEVKTDKKPENKN